MRGMEDLLLDQIEYLSSGQEGASKKIAVLKEQIARVKDPEAVNKALLKRRIIGGLPLGRFYPELADSMLFCATEMSRKAEMDAVAEVLA